MSLVDEREIRRCPSFWRGHMIERSFQMNQAFALTALPPRCGLPPYFSRISRTRVASASIAKGFVIIDMPGSKKPAAIAAFSA